MKIILQSIIILVLLFFLSCTFGEKDATYKLKYKGVILKNYQDDNNHGMLTFDVKDNDIKFSVLSEKWSNCWEYAEVGDSVIKLPDTLILIIKKPNGKEKHFKYDW